MSHSIVTSILSMATKSVSLDLYSKHVHIIISENRINTGHSANLCQHYQVIFDTQLSIRWNWHDDVIKWKHFPRYWPFVRGIHRSPVNSPHKGQWRGALMFSLICVWINGSVNNREAGDLRCYGAHYDVIVMWYKSFLLWAAEKANTNETLFGFCRDYSQCELYAKANWSREPNNVIFI